MKHVCLLDLNYTLVANSEIRLRPLWGQIEGEQYRADLIAAVSEDADEIILITARPSKYMKATLHSIESKTGWHPDRWFFNSLGLPPHEWKRRVVTEQLSEYLKSPDVSLFGVESNPRTRMAYETLGIESLSYADYMAARSGTA